MKKNNLVLLILLIGVGCSKSKDYPSLFSRLEKKAGSDEKLLRRYLATSSENKCLKDVFSVGLLQAEVKELEKKYTSGTKIKGTWKHLNLEDLPIPQAAFLDKFGDSLGDLNNPDAFDFSACRDVPCVINTIYGKEDSVAGYVHYIWYLRMGHFLAATNKVHENKEKHGTYNGKQFPVASYLYRDAELFGFWRLSHMLKAPHTTLTNLKEIHRVPRGESYDFVVEKRKNGYTGLSEACGVAYSVGYVTLQDICLSLNSDWESGNFYEAVLHELTHQVDYHLGRKTRTFYRSTQDDYLNVSKFVMKEYKTDSGETKREWEHLPGIKLVSNYAGTSPMENFAETLAMFRMNAPLTKKDISPEHYSFVSKNFFDGDNFEKQTLIKSWIEEEAPLMSQLAFKAVGDCASAGAQSASGYFKTADFTSSMLPTMLNCLGAKASEISLELRSKIKISRPDGCGYLGDADTKNLWEPALKPLLAGLMDKYLREHQKDDTYFQKIKEFIDQIDDRKIANEAYLSCSDISHEDSCYDEAVLRLSREALAHLVLPEEHAQDLAEMYLSNHALSDTAAYFNSYYRAFVSSSKELIDQEAEVLFMQCKAAPLSDEESPQGSLFQIGSGYMASSIYNCINTDFPEAAKAIVRNLTVDEMKVTHPKEEVLLYNEVVPELRKSLEAIYLEQRKLEEAAIVEFKGDDEGQIRKLLLNDLSWVKNGFSTENIFQDCQTHALEKIEFPLRYQTRMEAFGLFAQEICRNIEQTPEYSKWLEESKNIFAQKSSTGLESLIVELATLEAKKCLVPYPVNTNVERLKFKTQRESCLMNAWPSVEAAAIKKFSADPLVAKFNVDMNALTLKLETNRRRLQLRVIKENF